MGNHDKFIDAMRKGRIKGITRLILEDIVTRKRTVIEDSNMVTAAINKIFDSNYLGIMDYNHLMPLTKLFGGLFMFWNTLTESTENIYPPSQGSNKLTGYAGQTSHSSANPYRGNPNGAAAVFDPANGHVKFVWDFQLEQANGTISAVCLTSAAAGDVGLYPDGTAALMEPYGNVESGLTSFTPYEAGGAEWDQQKANRAPMKIDNDGFGISVFVSGNIFKETKVRHPFVRPCLLETYSAIDNDSFTVMEEHSATLSRSYTSGYTVIGQDDSYYYIIERDSGSTTTLYVDKVSKSDYSVTSQTISLSGVALGRPAMSAGGMNNGIVSDGFIYWVSNTNAKNFVRIDMTTPANSVELTTYMIDDLNLKMTPISGSAGLILGKNFLINGDFVYPVAIGNLRPKDTQPSIATFYSSSASYKNSPLVYQMGSYEYNVSNRRMSAGPVLYLPYLATINNLQTPAQKDATKILRVEYDLFVVSGGA